MSKETVRRIALVAILAVFAGGLWWYMTSVPVVVNTEVSETDRQIGTIRDESKEFSRVKESITTETKGKVVVIRENVLSEVRALDPDGLAAAALYEIELFRGSAGGDLDSGASGLDGAK